MTPVRFPGANRNYGAPTGWDEARDGVCETLPVHETVENGHRICLSIWEPNDLEREAIAAGANIALSCFGGQVPVMVFASAMGPDGIMPGFMVEPVEDNETSQPVPAG